MADDFYTQRGVLEASLQSYFRTGTNHSKLWKALHNKRMSLRIVDALVTGYARENTLCIKDKNVYLSYKNQLKSYQKKNFDPFCRQQKFPLRNGELHVMTTLGQCNFFRWLFVSGIWDWLSNDKNRTVIHKYMHQRGSNKRKFVAVSKRVVACKKQRITW